MDSTQPCRWEATSTFYSGRATAGFKKRKWFKISNFVCRLWPTLFTKYGDLRLVSSQCFIVPDRMAGKFKPPGWRGLMVKGLACWLSEPGVPPTLFNQLPITRPPQSTSQPCFSAFKGLARLKFSANRRFTTLWSRLTRPLTGWSCGKAALGGKTNMCSRVVV